MTTLVESVLGPVKKTRHRRGGVEEGQGRLHHVVDPAGVAALRDVKADAVDVVVVDEGDEAVLPLPVLRFGAERLGELSGPLPVDEDVLDRLAHGEEERGVERVAGILAVAGEDLVVVDEIFAEEDKVVFAACGRVLAHVVGPLLDPLLVDVLDGVDAEAIAIGGVDEVFEGLGDPIFDVVFFRGEVVGALELAVDVFGEGVPVFDRAVVVEPLEVVERVRMLPVVVPPTERVVAAAVVALVVLLVVAPKAVAVGRVVDDHIEDDVNAARMAGVDEVLQLLERAHDRVDVEEVGRVIHVVGRVVDVFALVVHLHAGNPHSGDTHPGKVIEIVLQPLPVAAVVVVAVLRETFARLKPTRAIDPHRARRVVVRIAVGETIGEELVDVHVAPILR